MVICFTVFLVNDLYGYVNWLSLKKKQMELVNKMDELEI